MTLFTGVGFSRYIDISKIAENRVELKEMQEEIKKEKIFYTYLDKSNNLLKNEEMKSKLNIDLRKIKKGEQVGFRKTIQHFKNNP